MTNLYSITKQMTQGTLVTDTTTNLYINTSLVYIRLSAHLGILFTIGSYSKLHITPITPNLNLTHSADYMEYYYKVDDTNLLLTFKYTSNYHVDVVHEGNIGYKWDYDYININIRS